jgi:hypothetical protein
MRALRGNRDRVCSASPRMSTQPEPARGTFDRHRKWLIILPFVATLLPLAMFEAGVRLFIEPSPYSYGKFRGAELPPLKLIPFPRAVRPDLEAPFQDLVVGGEKITRGDLFGYRREDPDIGYVNEENRRSKNGWWQSNEIGARSRTPTPRAVPVGLRRVVVFGDSFAAGTRLPQDAMWTAQLQGIRPDLDIVNLGIDGYGLGQALLLDRRMRGRIDYDVALYLFVPWHDPWHDVNVMRYLGEGWSSFTPMPRFVLDGEGLRLVPPFYPRGTMVYERDHPEASPELSAHLHTFDRFYIPYLYEPPPVVSRFVLWKLIAAKRGENARRRIREEIGRNVDGEAYELSRRILKTAHDEGAAAGHRVVVAVLPVQANLAQIGKSVEAREHWRRIVSGIRAQGIETIDLADALAAAPPEDLDAGYDGTHYGPRASAVIAGAIAAALR